MAAVGEKRQLVDKNHNLSTLKKKGYKIKEEFFGENDVDFTVVKQEDPKYAEMAEALLEKGKGEKRPAKYPPVSAVFTVQVTGDGRDVRISHKDWHIWIGDDGETYVRKVTIPESTQKVLRRVFKHWRISAKAALIPNVERFHSKLASALVGVTCKSKVTSRSGDLELQVDHQATGENGVIGYASLFAALLCAPKYTVEFPQ